MLSPALPEKRDSRLSFSVSSVTQGLRPGGTACAGLLRTGPEVPVRQGWWRRGAGGAGGAVGLVERRPDRSFAS